MQRFDYHTSTMLGCQYATAQYACTMYSAKCMIHIPARSIRASCDQSVAHVVQDWEESPDLAKWVGRQRVARAQGGLSEERLQVLYAMGFEFGEVAQLTDAWEAKFDQLIEWVLWQVHRVP